MLTCVLLTEATDYPEARDGKIVYGGPLRCLWEKRAPVREFLCVHLSRLKGSKKDTLSGTLLVLIGNTSMIASNHKLSLGTYLQWKEGLH